MTRENREEFPGITILIHSTGERYEAKTVLMAISDAVVYDEQGNIVNRIGSEKMKTILHGVMSVDKIIGMVSILKMRAEDVASEMIAEADDE